MITSSPRLVYQRMYRDALKVPTYQQRLMLGETELEDWDEEDKPLVLYNYPSIQNGSIICLIVLINGMHVKKASQSRVAIDCSSVSPSKKNLYFDLEEEDFFSDPTYINIPDPKRFTLKKLNSCLKPVPSLRSRGQCHTVEIIDAPVSTVPWITDGCTLCLDLKSGFLRTE